MQGNTQGRGSGSGYGSVTNPQAPVHSAKNTNLYNKCVKKCGGDKKAGERYFYECLTTNKRARRQRKKLQKVTAVPASVASPPVGGADDEAPAPKRQKRGAQANGAVTLNVTVRLTLDGDGTVSVVEAKLHRVGWQTDCIVGVKVALETAKAAPDTNVTLTLTQDGDSMVSVLA